MGSETRSEPTKGEKILSVITAIVCIVALLFYDIIPGWPFRHIGAYGGSMPFSSIPQQVIQQVKTNSNKDIQPDGVIFILYYQNDSGYHLVSFKLSDKYGGKEMWFASINGQDIETQQQNAIALNINQALQSESGLQFYVKEGYAVRIPKLKSDRHSLFVIFKLYHILPETTFNWFRIVHKAEIDKYVFKETSKDYAVTHYTGVYPEFP
jgi:hypothetical protein